MHDELITRIEKFAVENSLTLTANYRKILERIMKKNGNCPCRMDEVPCPCEDALQDVEENGKCHCGFFERV